MHKGPRRSVSVFDTNAKKEKDNFLDRNITLSGKQLAFGTIIGVFLTIITIILYFVAFVTPHWKEISPNTNSLYVDGVDALIRNEVLVYFNSVHRFTRQSYGLFQRCEYVLRNSSKPIQRRQDIFNSDSNQQRKICTKNYLPSFKHEQFNECHSLQYYRFCAKGNGKIFDIDNDYLLPTYDISSNSNNDIHSTSSCACQYPKYTKACHIIGIFALLFLIITAILFGIFPFRTTPYQRLKVKCFAVLFGIFSILLILINILIVSSYSEHESVEYLMAVEKHYRASEIHKLSQDTKIAINQFISSIDIKMGYSAYIAWIAFVLSIIDIILLMITCKVTPEKELIKQVFDAMTTQASMQDDELENEESPTSTSEFIAIETTTDTQHPPPLPPPLPPTITISGCDEQSKTNLVPRPSCLKKSFQLRTSYEDEV